MCLKSNAYRVLFFRFYIDNVFFDQTMEVLVVTDSEEDDAQVDATYRPGAKLANERKSSGKRKRRKGKFEYLKEAST